MILNLSDSNCHDEEMNGHKHELPRSMVCSEGSVGIPQNMMLVSMVQSNREKQHDTR